MVMIGVSEESTLLKNPPILGKCHWVPNNDQCQRHDVNVQLHPENMSSTHARTHTPHVKLKQYIYSYLYGSQSHKQYF